MVCKKNDTAHVPFCVFVNSLDSRFVYDQHMVLAPSHLPTRMHIGFWEWVNVDPEKLSIIK